MFKRSSVIALGIIAGLSVVACGGGGGGSSAPAPNPSSNSGNGGGGTSSQSAAVAPATFVITIPNGSSSTSSTKRRIKTVSASTASVVFTLVQSSAAGATLNQPSTPYALTTSSPNCTTVAAGLQCSIGINAVVGTDLYTVNTYSSTNAASGTQVGSGAFKIVVAANRQNTASLTLSGTVASLLTSTNIPVQYGEINNVYLDGPALSLPNESVTGLTTSGRLYVIALDSSGNTILAPETYSQTIYLSLLAVSDRPTYGQLKIAYDSGDGVPAAGTTVVTSATVKTLPIYSPQDVITVQTTASDEYTYNSDSPLNTIIAFAGLTSTPPSSPPGTAAVTSIDIFPDVTPASPTPVPSPTGAIAFTGINIATPAPAPSPTYPAPSPAATTPPTAPDPTLVGFGPSQSTYYNGIYADASASLDLSPSFNIGESIYVFLTDSLPTASFQAPVVSDCSYIQSVTSPVPLGNNLFRFSLVDNTASNNSGCQIQLTDSSGTQAVLEVYWNSTSVTVQSKGRKH